MERFIGIFGVIAILGIAYLLSNIEISILYGGSVNLSNYKELLAVSSISGLLIGSASL